LRRHSVFDHRCLLAQELIKQLLQLVEGLGQTLSAQQLGDHGATDAEPAEINQAACILGRNAP